MTIKFLKLIYVALWLFAGIWITLCETNIIAKGYWATDVQKEYFGQIFCIITAIGGSYLACRLFALSAVKRCLKNEQTAQKALIQFNALRLVILAMAILPSLFFYYGQMNSSALYCFLIALVSSLFCWPSDNP